MRNKIFWKILLSFWLAFFLAVPVVWIPVTVLFGEHPPTLGGSVGTPEGVSSERRLGDGMATMRDPSGDPEEFRRFTLQVLIVGAITGLIFSVVLARYLTRPISALQSGFRKLAQGQFDVELAKQLGGRRDEIADLAQEFDDTARRINALVTARDRLLHEISHELRTPLSRLLLAISIFQQQPARAREMGLRIEREAANLSSLLGEILALARSEGEGNGTDGENYYDPILVLAEVVADARFEAQSRDLKIMFDCSKHLAPETLTVRGNPQMLVRACENALRNAIRFSPSGGAITIVVDVLDHLQATLEIVISDQGPGILDADLMHIFEPFSTDRGTGFGLGLSIARRAIQSQRGTIEASTLPCGGLQISISIPVNTQEDESERPFACSPSAPRAQI